jgi:high-affinity K+ transport system ATPase subunit B
MAINWKNPIIFGVIIGIVLCLFLFLHDKLFRKKEDKSGFSVYLKLFMAGFLASGSMAWLFFNRDLRFSSSASTVIEHKGGAIELDDIANTVASETKVPVAAVVEKVKGLKRCHADEPDW